MSISNIKTPRSFYGQRLGVEIIDRQVASIDAVEIYVLELGNVIVLCETAVGNRDAFYSVVELDAVLSAYDAYMIEEYSRRVEVKRVRRRAMHRVEYAIPHKSAVVRMVHENKNKIG